MARPQQPGLTENELEVMKILWEDAPLKVAEILERIGRASAYTSLLTLVQAMERKGYIGHQASGKAYAYFPKLQRKNYRASEIQRVAKRLFDGNPFSLAVNLIKDEHLSEAEVAELRRLLEAK